MKILISILFFFLLCSCNLPSKLVKFVRIDNPGEKPITVSFDDGPLLTLAPGETQEIKVRSGTRYFVINNEPPVEIYLDADKSYLLNPTRATYILETVTYFPSEEAAAIYFEANPGVEIDLLGFKVVGHYKKIEKELFMLRDWEYGIGYSAAKTRQVLTGTRKPNSAQVTKLHREADLFETLMRNALGQDSLEDKETEYEAVAPKELFYE